MNRAIFLDRDGVINRKVPEMDFVKNPGELVYLPGVREIISMLKNKGYIVIVVSNQSGINRGIIKKEELEKIDGKLKKDLGVDGIYYCPHLPEENCLCRKPKTGLIERAARDFDIDVRKSLLVGDNDSDIIAGNGAGCRTIMVNGDIGIKDAENKLAEVIENVSFSKPPRTNSEVVQNGNIR